MIRTSEIETLLCNGGTVIDRVGEKVGDIRQIFLDDNTGQAAWVTVSTSRFGLESFIPLRDGLLRGTTIQVPYDRDKVKRAVLITGSTGPPSPTEAARLYAFYGRPAPPATDSSQPRPGRSEST